MGQVTSVDTSIVEICELGINLKYFMRDPARPNKGRPNRHVLKWTDSHVDNLYDYEGARPAIRSRLESLAHKQ
jgi:hypothetical protein